MTGYKLGGSDGLPKARAIPKGTKVRIVSMGLDVSKQFATREKRDGTEVPNLQLKVVVAPLTGGKTVAYTSTHNGSKKDFPSRAFEAGEEFVQYYGSVWDNGNGDYAFTGGAKTFVQALIDGGITPPANIEDFAGIVFAVDHERTSGPNGPSVRIMPTEGTIEAGKPTKRTSKPTDVTNHASAWDELPTSAKETILGAGSDVTAEDIVDAGLADGPEHAAAILASMPKTKPKAAKLAAKGG